MIAALLLLLLSAAPAESSQQLVVVTSSSWTAITARLQRFERQAQGTPWQPIGPPVDVVVGDGGLGWGIGLHEFASGPSDPRKREGDGRAPAGVFALTRVFGKGGVPQTRMQTRTTSSADVCVDDVKSPLYNTILREPSPAPEPRPYDSAERLLRADALYDLFVVVDHNHIDGAAKAIKGAGSCVFLHQWLRPGSPSNGCTAMSAAALTDVVTWLDPAKRPLLVQLPRDVYARVRDPWQLP